MTARTKQHVTAVVLAALAFAAGVTLTKLAYGQEQPKDYSDVTITVDSPSFMECVHCESFHRHSQMLKRQYPGIQIKERKWTEAQTKAAGIKWFPRIWVCKRLDGFGTDERLEIRRILDEGGGGDS